MGEKKTFYKNPKVLGIGLVISLALNVAFPYFVRNENFNKIMAETSDISTDNGSQSKNLQEENNNLKTELNEVKSDA